MNKFVTGCIAFGLLMVSCKNNPDNPELEVNENRALQIALSETVISRAASFPRDYSFSASGNEPFWSLEINDETIVLKTPEDTLISPWVEPLLKEDTQSCTYTVQTEGHSLFIEIDPIDCSDTMSDTSYAYTVRVKYTADFSKPKTKIVGCGSFLIDQSLTGNWVLSTMQGRAMKASDFGAGLPSISFDLNAQRFSGSTGCNRMNGTVVYDRNRFGFERIMTTKALCRQGQENEDDFMRILSEVDGYTFEGDTLIFLKEGYGVLVFTEETTGKK